MPQAKKVIANGFNQLNIPVFERRSIAKQDLMFQNITIETEAELDFQNEKFPFEKQWVYNLLDQEN